MRPLSILCRCYRELKTMREDKDRLVCDIPSGDFPGRVLPPLALLCALLREGLWPTIKCQFRGQVDDPATFRRMITPTLWVGKAEGPGAMDWTKRLAVWSVVIGTIVLSALLPLSSRTACRRPAAHGIPYKPKVHRRPPTTT